mmetsp:Transcript_1482/g.2736  ORF Transcript_1482/g.2736 Transcript_1482/m.2736 type:complete len:137 (+) Transcript_1482:369-779(+)|eukprot:CAMPEP_0114246856 /NCGR_PEP_ID=MMETSP0058-20121206/12701_1 /TAXON_ID=36894 /ORGANISM="Pyramimonas parkeae, CCMP726" /LENGTH=136 /DNA_ID=CAMNT_0001360101 /DNA_START=348 /DNA_END=758 /DNA_ORIENTATION=-
MSFPTDTPAMASTSRHDSGSSPIARRHSSGSSCVPSNIWHFLKGIRLEDDDDTPCLHGGMKEMHVQHLQADATSRKPAGKTTAGQNQHPPMGTARGLREKRKSESDLSFQRWDTSRAARRAPSRALLEVESQATRT